MIYPHIKRDDCTGCGECISMCPLGCLVIIDDMVYYKLEEGDCIGCEACVPACMNGCITIEHV